MTHRSAVRPAAVALAVLTLAASAAAQPPRSIALTPSPSKEAPAPKARDTKRPAAAPTAIVEQDYHLTVGDKLRVEVYRDQQLSQSVQIRPDGKITLPLIGDVEARGLTPLDLRERIAVALKEYVNNPVVTVIVVEAVTPTAYVVGEVNSPGAIALQGPMTVLQALAMAGGLNEWANGKNIRILRPGPSNVETIAFDYREAIRGSSGLIYLRPGDTIVVP
jgi:polysaccharide export outer membrane protein